MLRLSLLSLQLYSVSLFMKPIMIFKSIKKGLLNEQLLLLHNLTVAARTVNPQPR